jgi:predicted nucleic acid-binding protein
MDTPSRAPRFDTAQIGPLRNILARFANLKPAVGDFVQFRVVVDANFVIQELMQRVRFPERRTALEELIRATVIDAYAPRWLDFEMPSAIAQTAAKRKMSAEALWVEWQCYRQLLKWDESLRSPECLGIVDVDPKDAPYVHLEDKIFAHGILSKDAHIKRMGGHPLTLDFVFSARRYARGAVACVSIRVMGVMISTIALKAVVDALRATTRALTALPDGVKVLLLLSALLAVLHPGMRKSICDVGAEVGSLLAPIWNVLWEIAMAASALERDARSEATASLAEASAAVKPCPQARLRRRRPRRSRSVRLRAKDSPTLIASKSLK